MSVYQSAPALEQAAITAKDFNFGTVTFMR